MTFIRRALGLTAVLLLFVHISESAQASAPPDINQLESSLAKIPSYSYGQDFAPLAAVSQFVRDARGDTDLLASLESRLIAVLKGEATPDGKKFVCEQLSLIGTSAAVPVLAQLVTAPETSDIARYALERIEAAEAAAALRTGLGKTGGKETIGIISSLGQRRDRQAVPLLTPLIYSADSGTAAAAVNSLGQIGDSTALKSLAEARRNVTGLLLEQVTDAYLRCLEHLTPPDKAVALSGYRQLNDPAEPAMIRVAALRGLVRLEPGKALETLAAALQSNVTVIQAAALQLTGGVSGVEATDLMIKSYPKLPVRGRVQALTALAARGDSSARSLLEQALTDDSAEVRIAAIEGMAKLGDASVVGRMADIASAGSDAERSAARMTLARLNAAGVDEAIIAGIADAPAKIKVELIRAAGNRRIDNAADQLVKTARDEDSEVRRESRRALRETAQTRHLPELLGLLKQTRTPSERSDLENALVATVKRYDMAGADQLTSGLSDSDVETRASLLQITGKLGYEAALPLLRAALKDDEPEVQRAAVLGLTEWPTSAPLLDLLQVAGQTGAENVRVLALRGFVRLAGIPSERTTTESVKLLADALKLQPGDDEKKAILSLLPRFASPEALKLAGTLKQGSVSAEAALAVERIKHALEQK